MKKATLALSLLMALGIGAGTAKAQTVDSLPHYNIGRHYAQTATFMGMSDSCLLGGILIADLYPYSPVGYTLHKVSRHDALLTVSDTLFMPYEHLPWHLTAKMPQGDGNIFAEFATDYINGSCYIKIKHFDDHLDFDSTETIVPVADFTANSGDPGVLLDSAGDIILSYYDYHSSPLEFHFVRMGVDGTVKYHNSIDTLRIDAGNLDGPIVFSESPLTYCCWGDHYDNNRFINCYLLDSKFDVTGFYTLPRESGPPDYVNYDNDGSATKLMGMDDGCFLVARHYNRPYPLLPHVEDDGVAVMKYDRDFHLLARRKFLSEPYIDHGDCGAQPIGLEKSKDGHVYFAYFTQSFAKESQVSVVKMDSDLNIIWQRHCLSREYGRDYGRMAVLDNNSVAIMGITALDQTGYLDHSEVFYLIVHDDYDALEEQGFAIRPYAFYPNPVQSELHLQYSPDVQPARIELYDLQGRLLQTRTQGLESIGLEGLAAGQYLMKVTLEDGKTFTDKVVKE